MNFENWINSLLPDIPDTAIAFNLNLYETDSDEVFEAQLVGCNHYDFDDEDWACNTIYSSEEDIYEFKAEDWEDALNKMIDEFKKYLSVSDANNKIKKAEYITAGFIDGNLEQIFSIH